MPEPSQNRMQTLFQKSTQQRKYTIQHPQQTRRKPTQPKSHNFEMLQKQEAQANVYGQQKPIKAVLLQQTALSSLSPPKPQEFFRIQPSFSNSS